MSVNVGRAMAELRPLQWTLPKNALCGDTSSSPVEQQKLLNSLLETLPTSVVSLIWEYLSFERDDTTWGAVRIHIRPQAGGDILCREDCLCECLMYTCALFFVLIYIAFGVVDICLAFVPDAHDCVMHNVTSQTWLLVMASMKIWWISWINCCRRKPSEDTYNDTDVYTVCITCIFALFEIGWRLLGFASVLQTPCILSSSKGKYMISQVWLC